MHPRAGSALFGVVFAINSSVHSYLILAYSDGDKVAMNVGFYYMANAGGRLVGTLLSGVLFQVGGRRRLPLGVGRLRGRGRGASRCSLPHKETSMRMAEMKAEGAD